ncbi:hypothetical protein IWQ56_002479 [Coemansia nantahalensis]|nr:hypothetical protein IWQ56_002479 [Coemansia nantahalensis]
MPGNAQLDRCVRLLSRRTTDDEKFAGLLLVPRIVDPQDGEALARIFEALDCTFIERLLRTGLKQVTARPDGDGPALLAIAVSVVDVLASQPAIAGDARMLDRIPTLCWVACLDAQPVADEAIQALCRMLAQDAAVRVLLADPGLLAAIVDAAGARGDSLGLSRFLDFTLNRCSAWIAARRADDRDAISGWVTAVTHAAAAFATSATRLKFELLPVLANALEPIGPDDSAAADEHLSCSPLVRHTSAGCIAILRQKTEAATYTDQALVLYAHLVRLWPGHVFLGVMLPPADGAASAAAPSQEAELALRVACVEGQTAVDAMMICVPDQSSASAARDADRLRVQRGWKLPCCATIAAGWLEWAARWLEDQPESAAVNEAGICAMMSEVQRLASAAVGFLVDWRERVPGEQDMLANGPELVLCLVRLLGQWLATDPTLHRPAMPVLAMCAAWAAGGGDSASAVAECMRPCIAFALETCGISEAQYVEELVTRELRHARPPSSELTSPWVGTMEFDDLTRAAYGIPSDEDVLRERQARLHDNKRRPSDVHAEE